MGSYNAPDFKFLAPQSPHLEFQIPNHLICFHSNLKDPILKSRFILHSNNFLLSLLIKHLLDLPHSSKPHSSSQLPPIIPQANHSLPNSLLLLF